MMMTLQNAMRQQPGQMMFPRNAVKLDPVGHHLSTVEILHPTFTGVGDAFEVDEDILLAAAHQEYKAGNCKLALQHCLLVHDKSPRRTDALLLLGAIYYQLHDYDMCIAKNQQAIHIEPQFAECYSNMANALKEKGDIEIAIQYYLTAIELKPSFCDAWSNLASAYMRQGKLQEAADCCRHALMLNPRLVDAHSNLGNLLKAQGLTHHAYLCYIEAIRLQPTFAIAWSNLAGLLMEAGELQKALVYYKEAIRLKPNFADAHLNQGNVLKALGRHQEAVACYNRSIQLQPDCAIAYGQDKFMGLPSLHLLLVIQEIILKDGSVAI